MVPTVKVGLEAGYHGELSVRVPEVAVPLLPETTIVLPLLENDT